MIKVIDNWLNKITMYRLVLYYLVFLLWIAVMMCFAGLLPYDPFSMIVTVGFLIAACWVTNTIFANIYEVPRNVESVYISALILALIVNPLKSGHDLIFLGWVAVLSMASKYIIAINRKHIFNPVAFAVALTALTVNQTASWWVGTLPMLPFVVVGGLLIVRKIRRSDLVVSFGIAALVTILVLGFMNGQNLITIVSQTLFYSPLAFFAFIILTEPLTTPPTQKLQVYYGAMVGVLFAPQLHIGSFYFTPELAILAGNVYSYLVSPKTKLMLRLKEKIRIAPDVYDFIFVPNQKLAFAPGQYMEWTLWHSDPDSRGNRRYFTLASSPTEDHLRVGVKFYPQGSTFKKSMLKLDSRREIVAAQLAGDFVLPENRRQKCVFIAGGIGITPFRSMIKYMLDTNQKRPLVLFYSNKTADEIVYRDVFDKAQKKFGLKTIYTLTDTRNVPPLWEGKTGYITEKMIREEVPDFQRCVFYISGPNAMVTDVEAILTKMSIPKHQIKTDFFPGFA